MSETALECPGRKSDRQKKTDDEEEFRYIVRQVALIICRNAVVLSLAHSRFDLGDSEYRDGRQRIAVNERDQSDSKLTFQEK